MTITRVKSSISHRRITANQVKSVIDQYIASLTDSKGNIIKEPLLMEVALLLGIGQSTLREYQQIPAYAASIKKVKDLGELWLNRLMEGDKANANAMFKLKTRHGYIEQQKVDISTAGQPLGIIQLPTR